MYQDKEVINQLMRLPDIGGRMPVLFIGHGSPMNAIEENEFSVTWKQLSSKLPIPRAILVISAHWLTKGTYVTASQKLQTIHDFGGFPQALFDIEYPTDGSPLLAEEVQHIVRSTTVQEDMDWGLDHGSWSVLRRMYPLANIPVVQLSIDYYQGGEFHYKLGSELSDLRNKGVLIIGSGNIVHNLRMIDWKNMDTDNYAFDWSIESNELIKKSILDRNFKVLVDHQGLGHATKLAIPTPDHYYPLLYTLGLVDQKDEIEIFNDKYVGGSLSMTSYLFGRYL
ncbi:4,5-DOPA dioxygenase extradiol [Myroides albus]|uniref:4,5-DOPA-extradiol-dioxygenase n=1 Tax=Myroides albus TaxID=2562892 RepID=UPI00215977E9|nr:4,5-DOPA dioxygenase extradiol [Myroides albus]UVD79538.1 4,5-DOPA dioxygenase extradiol [Myroides albus]